MKLCKCGCGQELSDFRNTYIHGHYWNGKSRLFSEEWKKNLSTPMSEKTKQKISNSLKDTTESLDDLEQTINIYKVPMHRN